MKLLLALSMLSFAFLDFATAEDAKRLLNPSGKVISRPDLRQPLGAEWTASRGKWEPADGVLTATELPEEKHAAVLHLATGPGSIIVECEFRFNGGKVFYVGCDGSKHVGRLVVTPKNARLCEDSTEVKGKTPSHVLAEASFDSKGGEWQKLRVESTGDKMAAWLDGAVLTAQHPYLATPKVRWWFASSGATVQLRNIVVSEGKPEE